MARLHLRITGRVQGVFYRVTAQRAARQLGLTGWVKNRDDGSVELVVEGPIPACEALRAQCESGPPGARVTELVAHWSESSGGFEDFDVRH